MAPRNTAPRKLRASLSNRLRGAQDAARALLFLIPEERDRILTDVKTGMGGW